MPRSGPLAHDDVPSTFVCACVTAGLDAAWVQVAGELDIATAPQLEWTLGEAVEHARLVALDLRDLAFMDCTGAHLVVYASMRARELGRRLVVLRGPPNIDRVFTLTGCAAVVEFADSDLTGALADSGAPLSRSLEYLQERALEDERRMTRGD